MLKSFLRANVTSDAEDTRKTAAVKNHEYQNLVNHISTEIIRESELGLFGTTVSTNVYNDDTLVAVANYFSKKGYHVHWEQVRGAGCHERVFYIGWY